MTDIRRYAIKSNQSTKNVFKKLLSTIRNQSFIIQLGHIDFFGNGPVWDSLERNFHIRENVLL